MASVPEGLRKSQPDFVARNFYSHAKRVLGDEGEGLIGKVEGHQWQTTIHGGVTIWLRIAY